MAVANVVSYFVILIEIFVLVAAQHSHSVPTYFARLDENGTLIDRSLPEYDIDIKGKEFINLISRNDASKIKLEAWPNVVKNGDKITVLWQNVEKPQSKDFIAYYCPYYDDLNHYLDYIWVRSSMSWREGYGHQELTVYNMRTTCVFKYYRASGKYYILAAVSNKVNFADGGPYAPLQGHIALANEPTEMRVMWVSGEVHQPPVVRYGTTKHLSMKEHAHLTHTYTKDALCQKPANAGGFWHPGNVYDVVLKDLFSNTLYYYAYGTEEYLSAVANFTTPIIKGDPTPYKFIVYGDMGIQPYPEAVTTAKNIRKEVDENDIRFVFHNGDISYARGYAYIWEQWFDMIQPYATLVPYMVGIGNHEYDHTDGGEKDPSEAKGNGGFRPSWWNGGNDSGGECGVAMVKRFHMPDNGNSVFWYSYDYGLVHMIMMSSEHDYSPGSPQYTWLANDLKNVNRKVTPWLLIGAHRPMYSSEKIYSDYVVSEHMQELFEDLLYKYKVDIAFWAHYHSYERTCKLYKSKCVDDGIVHIVVGSAGKSKDIDEWYDKPWSLFHHSEYGYGRVTVANSSALLYEWVENLHYQVKDHVWLIK